jgi:hypothetical protein
MIQEDESLSGNRNAERRSNMRLGGAGGHLESMETYVFAGVFNILVVHTVGSEPGARVLVSPFGQGVGFGELAWEETRELALDEHSTDTVG